MDTTTTDLTKIAMNFANEREIITLEYLLFVVDMYPDNPEKIKEVIQQRIDKDKKDLES